jgi:hypothetical protein
MLCTRSDPVQTSRDSKVYYCRDKTGAPLSPSGVLARIHSASALTTRQGRTETPGASCCNGGCSNKAALSTPKRTTLRPFDTNREGKGRSVICCCRSLVGLVAHAGPSCCSRFTVRRVALLRRRPGHGPTTGKQSLRGGVTGNVRAIRLVLHLFSRCVIVLPKPPLLSVLSRSFRYKYLFKKKQKLFLGTPCNVIAAWCTPII